jgi:hypothetical protein
MSQSPSSAGAMGIGNVLNTKGNASSAQALQPGATPDQQAPAAPPHPLLPVDRPNSPHGSEHSRYSGPMNTSYPSPTAMGAAPLPPVPSANMAPAPMGMPGMAPNAMTGMPPGSYKVEAPSQAPAQAPLKAYPCSTCGKPFARRSDLARHGTPQHALFLLFRC